MTIYPGGPQDDIKYTMTGPDGSIATFNDQTDPNYVGFAWFSGLDSPDIRESIDARSATDGMVQGLNFRGGRPVIGTVEIVATSTTQRNQKFQRLRRAANALRRDGTLDFTPSGGLPSRVYFRLNQPIRRNDERGWKYTVQFPLMAADPYIYSQTLNTFTKSSAPFQTTITNQGDGRSAPVIEVTLTSASTLVLSNLTTGESISVNTIDPANLVTFVRKFGGAGSGTGLMTQPNGTAIDASGNYYVTDVGNNRVQKFNSSGTFVQQFGTGTFGTADGQFALPSDVAVDASGNVFVTDGGGFFTSRVQKFNSAGVFQAKNSTTMAYPRGVEVDSSGNVYVVDSQNNTVRKYANTLGAQTTNFGSSGSGNGQFNQASGIAIDASNQPWVVDDGNNRVQKFSNAATPVYVSQFSTIGPNSDHVDSYGIGIDTSGNVYVSDWKKSDIQKFNSSGVYQTTIGTFGTSDSQFNAPYLLAVRGTLMAVPEFNNNRVQVFDVGGSSGVLRFDHAVATVTTQGGVNLYAYVNVPSTSWWALEAGDNVIQVAGGSGLSSFKTTWRDAWL